MTASSRRIAIVANPTSGKGRARETAEALLGHLHDLGAEGRILWTEGRGDGTRQASRTLDEGYEVVVACGGDGTAHEVAQALAGSGRRVGIAPAGRCNDLARELAIPRDPATLAQLLTSEEVRRIDLARVGDRWYLTVGALGFDGSVSRFVDEEMRLPLRGKAGYVYGALRMLVRYSPLPLRLSGDFGEYEGPVFLAAIANTPTYGGAIPIAPEALVDDGKLDLCIIEPAGRLRQLSLLPRVLRRTHGRHPRVRLLRSKWIEVASAEPLRLWADGEPMATTPLRVEAVAGALEVIAPAPSHPS
jgi:diacylglycerol kinase (ATP)